MAKIASNWEMLKNIRKTWIKNLKNKLLSPLTYYRLKSYLNCLKCIDFKFVYLTKKYFLLNILPGKKGPALDKISSIQKNLIFLWSF